MTGSAHQIRMEQTVLASGWSFFWTSVIVHLASVSDFGHYRQNLLFAIRYGASVCDSNLFSNLAELPDLSTPYHFQGRPLPDTGPHLVYASRACAEFP